jgi:hypothetical protein
MTGASFLGNVVHRACNLNFLVYKPNKYFQLGYLNRPKRTTAIALKYSKICGHQSMLLLHY